MNTPEPPPSPSPARRLVWPLFVGVVVCGVVFGGWYLFTQLRGDRDDQIRAQDLKDPSLDFDEPWPSGNHIVENGRAYSQASVPLPPGTELILLEGLDATLQADGPAGTVIVLIEKRLFWYGHPGKTLRLREFSAEKRLWKKQVGAALVLTSDGGSSNIEGGSRVSLLVRTPPGTSVRREAISSPHFAGRYDERVYIPDDAARAAGWEEVPQRPLPKSEWPLPVERPRAWWKH